ncbi:MAG: hypothetical protein IB618_01810 [Candidatus Pacearchaeota archaeon]|nr:MAG: hypothetical protein IB618_01810 [Candidatus Pacearchaeota archaeon]
MKEKGNKIYSMQVSKIIEEDFKEYDKEKLIKLFREYFKDKRSIDFVKYYNKTVLDKEKINFGMFSNKWALHLRKSHIDYLDKNYKLLKKEILNKKNIYLFYKKFGIDKSGRRNKSFCCKLFHTFLPNEFIPLDNPIRNHFKLKNFNSDHHLWCEKIIRNGYLIFISKNKEKIKLIKEVLSDKESEFFRIKELSDIRLMDMIYWFILNRRKEKIIKMKRKC